MSIYTHPEELMKQWGAMAACHCYLISDAHEVMAALIVV
jgi:hypothetical protein